MSIDNPTDNLQPTPEQPENLRLMLESVNKVRTTLFEHAEGSIFVKDYKGYWINNIDRCLNMLQDPVIVKSLDTMQVLSIVSKNLSKTEELLKLKNPIIVKDFNNDHSAQLVLLHAMINLNNTQTGTFTVRLSNKDRIVRQDIFPKIIRECKLLKQALVLNNNPLIEVEIITRNDMATHRLRLDALKEAFQSNKGYLVSPTYENIPFYQNETTRLVNNKLATIGIYSCSI